MNLDQHGSFEVFEAEVLERAPLVAIDSEGEQLAFGPNETIDICLIAAPKNPITIPVAKPAELLQDLCESSRICH